MPSLNGQSRDRLTIIDEALGQIDDDLARKYPGLAVSRASLLAARRRLVELRGASDVITVTSSASEGFLAHLPRWRAPQLASALASVAFIAASGSSANTGETSGSRPTMWPDPNIVRVGEPANSDSTSSQRVFLGLEG